jgi:hypothetical protein
MTRTSTFALALLLSVGSMAAQAQTKLPPRKPVQPRAKVVAKGATLKDGVMMKEGKVLLTQQGLTNPITQETSLVNGTKIQPDGTVTMTNGTSVMMKEGDYMSLTGRLTTMAMRAEQDSLMQLAKNGGKGKMKMKKKGK